MRTPLPQCRTIPGGHGPIRSRRSVLPGKTDPECRHLGPPTRLAVAPAGKSQAPGYPAGTPSSRSTPSPASHRDRKRRSINAPGDQYSTCSIPLAPPSSLCRTVQAPVATARIATLSEPPSNRPTRRHDRSIRRPSHFSVRTSSCSVKCERGSVFQVVGRHRLPLLVGVDLESAQVARQRPYIGYRPEDANGGERAHEPTDGPGRIHGPRAG